MRRHRGKEGNGSAVWTVVYIANNQSTAETLRRLLEEAGLLAMLRPVGIAQHPGEARNVEILVPQSEVEEAHEVLAETLGQR